MRLPMSGSNPRDRNPRVGFEPDRDRNPRTRWLRELVEQCKGKVLGSYWELEAKYWVLSGDRNPWDRHPPIGTTTFDPGGGNLNH